MRGDDPNEDLPQHVNSCHFSAKQLGVWPRPTAKTIGPLPPRAKDRGCSRQLCRQAVHIETLNVSPMSAAPTGWQRAWCVSHSGLRLPPRHALDEAAYLARLSSSQTGK